MALQLVCISVPFCDLDVERFTLDLVKFLRRRLFQDGGTGGRSFIHRFVEQVGRLNMFIHNDRNELLYCFV